MIGRSALWTRSSHCLSLIEKALPSRPSTLAKTLSIFCVSFLDLHHNHLLQSHLSTDFMIEGIQIPVAAAMHFTSGECACIGHAEQGFVRGDF